MKLDDAIDQAEESQARRRRGVARSGELRRIAALPRRVFDPSTTEDLTASFVRKNSPCRGCSICRDGLGRAKEVRLRPIQSAALLEAQAVKGMIAPLPVGTGKTLLALLLPKVLDATRAVILVPPQLKAQLVDVDVPRYALHFDLPLERIAIVAYSELSSAKHADVLDRINPDLIIADEAHALRAATSARAKRFRRFMRAHPYCRLVAMSGTLCSKSVRDYAEAASFALGRGSPLPAGWGELEEWAAALDPDAVDRLDPGALSEFCDPGEDVRSGFRRRLLETPGVVSQASTDAGCALVIDAVASPFVPELKTELERLRKTWRLGDEEIDSAATLAMQARRLAFGFYYLWDWNGPVDSEWLARRAEWNQVVREVLRHRSRPGLDSPLFVCRAADNAELRRDELDVWAGWCCVKGRPQPPTIPRWVSRWAIDYAVAWARNNPDGGLIWYTDRAVEVELRKAGIFVYGGGEDSARLAALAEQRGPAPVIGLSINAHSDGKNLQRWSRSLVLAAPASAKTWEQMIGRTHRPGQEADEVTIEVFRHTEEVRSALDGACDTARFLEETQGIRQKLSYAQRVGW